MDAEIIPAACSIGLIVAAAGKPIQPNAESNNHRMHLRHDDDTSVPVCGKAPPMHDWINKCQADECRNWRLVDARPR
jgi:hypothetical protein